MDRDFAIDDVTDHTHENHGNEEGRLRAAKMLAERFGIESAFVRVEILAKVLGLAPSTIYAQLKAGRFCMPFRRINTIPLVKVEDLIDWYCDPGAERDFEVGPAVVQADDVAIVIAPVRTEPVVVSAECERAALTKKLVGEVLSKMARR